MSKSFISVVIHQCHWIRGKYILLPDCVWKLNWCSYERCALTADKRMVVCIHTWAVILCVEVGWLLCINWDNYSFSQLCHVTENMLCNQCSEKGCFNLKSSLIAKLWTSLFRRWQILCTVYLIKKTIFICSTRWFQEHNVNWSLWFCKGNKIVLVHCDTCALYLSYDSYSVPGLLIKRNFSFWIYNLKF